MEQKNKFLRATRIFERLFWNRNDRNKSAGCVQVILYENGGSMMNRVSGNPFIIPEAFGRFLYGYSKSLGLDIAEVLTRVINTAHDAYEDNTEVEHEFR